MNLQRYKKLEEIMETGDYYVDTDLGMIWSNKHQGQWLNQRIDSNDYRLVSLYLKGEPCQYRVHELIAYEVFGDALIDMTCNHRNGKAKEDNSSCNIDLMTMREQFEHAAENGLRGIKQDESKQLEAICLSEFGLKTNAIAALIGVKECTIRRYLKKDRFELQRTWLEKEHKTSKIN